MCLPEMKLSQRRSDTAMSSACPPLHLPPLISLILFHYLTEQ
jgi:hypothetical protein